MIKNHRTSDNKFDEKFGQLPELVSRLQRAILGHMDDNISAQKDSFEDELERKHRKYGDKSPDVKNIELRLNAHESMRSGIKAEMQRNKIKTPKPKPDCFIIHGRIVDRKGLGLSDLTINAIDIKSRYSVQEDSTDKHGYFKLEILSKAEGKKSWTCLEEGDEEYTTQIVLQVSDSQNTELYRDDDAHRVTVESVVYVEIILTSYPTP